MENANATATLVNQVIVLRVRAIPVLAVIVAAKSLVIETFVERLLFMYLKI